ncbi:hypothetical protein Adt_20982 [Abeliophyllum distichum]|uniref:Uncharacterized protein n=1 Tax=Abeliophyllum distichum TaxID=126358 RepID=A0ABD1SYA3_9LAMI
MGKMSAKRSLREMTPPSSSEEEASQMTEIDRCPVLIGKNVDLASFTFVAPSFHIEDLFASHLDEVNHYEVVILDSILIGRKLDFSYIMLQHMNSVLSGTQPKALSYGMILAKIFQHFEVSFRDSVVLFPKAIDTINNLTLKCMNYFKEDRQWVVKSKEFDDELGPSTLPFEGCEEMDEDEDDPCQDRDHINRHPPLMALLSLNIITIFLIQLITLYSHNIYHNKKGENC